MYVVELRLGRAIQLIASVSRNNVCVDVSSIMFLNDIGLGPHFLLYVAPARSLP